MEGRAVGGGAQRCATLSHCLGLEVMLSRCSWGRWLCAPTPLLIAPSLSLFSCPGLPCPFLLWPLPSSWPSQQSSSPAELKTLLALNWHVQHVSLLTSAAPTRAVGFWGAASDPTLPGSNGPRHLLHLSYVYSKCSDLQQVLIFPGGTGRRSK